MSISLHILVDNCPPELLDRALLYLQRTQQPVVNIAGGAQLDRAMAYVDRVRAALPTIKIFFRNLDPDDTGIWTKLNPDQWFASRIVPRLDWAKRNDIIHVTDNESSGSDDVIRRYAAWQVDVMGRLHSVGLHAAYGRFATGNIQESQYVLLKQMFDAARPGDYFSPNEYFNAPGGSSGGHLNRYKLAWQAAGRNLPTAIGEYAMAVGYDPYKGYQAIGMSGKDYVRLLVSNNEGWYKPNGVDVFVYCVGGYSWPTFQLNEEVFAGLETYAGTAAPAAPPPPLSQPVPPAPSPVGQTTDFPTDFDARAVTITLRGKAVLNVRTSPHLNSPIAYQLQPKPYVARIIRDNALTPDEKTRWAETIDDDAGVWLPVAIDSLGLKGWMFSVIINWLITGEGRLERLQTIQMQIDNVKTLLSSVEATVTELIAEETGS